MEQERYYRWSAAVDWTSTGGYSVFHHCASYPVIKRTRAGAFIDEYGRKRFILNDAKKKWAAPTSEEAWRNYKARSRQALLHAQNNLDKIKCAQGTDIFSSDTPPTNDNRHYTFSPPSLGFKFNEVQHPSTDF